MYTIKTSIIIDYIVSFISAMEFKIILQNDYDKKFNFNRIHFLCLYRRGIGIYSIVYRTTLFQN